MKLTAPQIAALRYYAKPAAERETVDPVRPNTYRVLRREQLVIPNAGGPVLTPAGRDALTRATLPAEELAIVERRAAALDAMPTDDEEPVIVRAGEAASLAQHDAPRQDLDGEFRCDEQGTARYWTAEEVAAERRDLALLRLDPFAVAAAFADAETGPVHYTREQIAARFREVDEFTLHLGPEDRAYDPETGDTLLGGVSIRYARGSFPGPSYTATILGDEPAVDDDPREQPRPLEWSEVAGS